MVWFGSILWGLIQLCLVGGLCTTAFWWVWGWWVLWLGGGWCVVFAPLGSFLGSAIARVACCGGGWCVDCELRVFWGDAI